MKRFLLASSLIALGTSTAFAQTPPGEDVVVVTGSRIAVDGPADAVSPVVAIGGDDIATSGQIDIVELLRESPQLQGSLPASFSAFNGGALGVGQLNLRGLGTERTLVLQNGRRHVSGVAGTGAVDVTTISTALLERVDILTGGASSIYGADAVTGVVNFVMRDGASFDGYEFRAQTGISSRGDADELALSLANGFMTPDERGSLVAAVEFTRSSPVFAGERSFAGRGIAGLEANAGGFPAALGVSTDIANVYATDRTLPISSPLGIISLTGSAFVDVLLSGGQVGCDTIGAGSAASPTCLVFDNGVLRPFNPGDIYGGAFSASGGDAVRVDPDNELILPDIERYILSAEGSYELFDGIEAFANVKFVSSETEETNQVNGFNDDIPISLDNPFIPGQLVAVINGLQGQGETVNLAISRDTLDNATLSSPIAERETLRFVGGLQGRIADTGLNFELSYNYGETDSTITTQRDRLEDRFFAAIDAVRGPNGDIICRSSLPGFDPTTPIPVSPFPGSPGAFATFQPGDGQCAPINIFGSNTISPDGAAFAFVPTVSNIKIEQEVFLATIAGDTGEYFNLPAGPIGFAVGYENRTERSNFVSDPLIQAELTFGSNNSGATLPVTGNLSVDELFGEVSVPLLADMPFVDRLEFKGAYRYSDYSTIGGADTYSLGGRWEVSPEVVLRGTYSRAVRAPNINELFSPLQPDSIGAGQDPCNPNFINAGSEFREANCLTFVSPGFDSTNFLSAFVPGQSGGNIDLEPETADTYTFGVVIEPTQFIENFQIIVDYYNIEIEGLIDTLTAFTIASNCVDLPDTNNQFCDAVDRDATNGFITGFRSGEINLGSRKTEGIDFSVLYNRDVPSIVKGQDATLSLGLMGTHFMTFDEAADPVDLDAIEDLQGNFTRPDWIVNFNVDYDLDRFGLGWRLRYEGDQRSPGVTNQDVESDPNFANITKTGDAFIHDFTASLELTEKVELYTGINNAFDRNPFIATLSRPAGPRGRFFFAGVNATF